MRNYPEPVTRPNPPQPRKFPWVWVLIALSIIVGLLIYISYLRTPSKVKATEAERDKLQNQVDTLTGVRDAEIEHVRQTSQAAADLGNSLTEKLPDEKIIIRDTTYDAMCKYITDYRPGQP